MQKNAAGNKKRASDGGVTINSVGCFAPTLSQRIYLPIKRLFDILFSSAMLIVLIPVFILATVLIKLEKLGPVMFCQQRMGKNGKIFEIYKFRTMHESAPKDIATAQLNDADTYITKVGQFLRRTSIDETPQFFNILKGDMAIIGPRPLVVSETEMHAMRMERGVYNMRPGLTGLAQVNGRDLVAPKEKVAYDEQYTHTFGFLTDLRILLRSVMIVLSHKGIVEGSSSVKVPVNAVNAVNSIIVTDRQPPQAPDRADGGVDDPPLIYEEADST